MAMSRSAKAMKNATGSEPLGVSYADFRISFNLHHLEDDYWREIVQRRITLALLVLYSIIFTLGIVGNGLVIVILGIYMKKTAHIIWFLNLTVANFIFSCSLPLRIAHNALKLRWPFGKAMCKINDMVAYLSLYVTAYFLMVVSICHLVSMRCSAGAQNRQRKWLVYCVAMGVWALALVLSSPRVHFRSTVKSPIDEEVVICFFNYGISFKWSKINHYVTLISQYLFAFVLPITVTTACLVKTAKWQGHVAQWSKPFRVTVAVTVTFYVCWIPYHVFSFVDNQLVATSHMQIIGLPLATGLAFASSCVSPILYIAMGYDFKERPRRPFLSAFQNALGEDSSHSMPETPAKPSAEMDSENV